MIIKIILTLLGITAVGYALFFAIVNRALSNASSGYELIEPNISNSYFFKEGNVYYCMSGNFFSIGAQALDNADLKSFTVLDSSFAKDKNHVYARADIIESADPNTLTVIDHFYFTDKNNAYFLDSTIKGADPLTFVVIKDYFSRDKSNIYYRNNRVDGISPNDFRYRAGMYAEQNENGKYELRTPEE